MTPFEDSPTFRAPLRLRLVEDRPGELGAIRARLEEMAGERFAISDGGGSSAIPGAGPEAQVILVPVDRLPAPEALDRIGALRTDFRVALVACSERHDPELLRRTLEAGADAVLSGADPSAASLQDAILTAVHGRRQRMRLERERDSAVHLNDHDRITNLENRHALERRLAPLLATALRKERRLGVLLVATGGLESVNDSLGQRAGNQLLRHLADRLLGAVRLGDDVTRQEHRSRATAVSHLGGSEFTVLLSEIRSPQDAARVAQRIIETLGRPFRIQSQEVFVQTSVGIAIFPHDGDSADALLRNARSARQRSEEEGSNRFCFYAPSMNTVAARRLKIASLLHRALERDEFSLHYQPLRHAVDGRLLAGEALLRWSTEELGSISPEEFIPVAEESSLIVAIGEWVLSTAAAQHRSWCEAGYAPIRLAVNLSARQLEGGQLVRSVRRILEETGMSPQHLELEITETTMARDDEGSRGALAGLREMGISFALDDFGTGFSSLTHLSRFPVDRLKIDRSFIARIAPDAGCRDPGASLASALIAMAHRLELGVVAEGVETVEQVDFLREQGCDELQGYLLGRPMSAGDFEHFLAAGKAN